MKSAREWMAKIPRDGHSFDYTDWVKEIQKDAQSAPDYMQAPHKIVRLSNTPRTDAMVSGNSDPASDEYADLSEFCRQLERELNAQNIQIDGLKELLRKEL